MKRFSTLLAAFVLIGAVTASAAGLDTSVKLNLGQNAGLYQLTTKIGQALAVETSEDGTNNLVLKATPTAFDATSYWCVTVTQENKGQTPIFDFINKGAQCFLDASMLR